MRLTAKLFTTLDGVYQGPGGPDEDRRGGFDRGGWQSQHQDDELGSFIRSAYRNADAMLLGRVTWGIWEGYWPHHDDNPIGHTINVLPKYVPSTTLTGSTWQNTHFLAGDVEAAVRELKAMPGRDLLLQGSGRLVRWLLERDLVDELSLVIYPVVVGDGLRLFPDRGPTHMMELVESRPTPSGISIQTYRPAGRLMFGTIEA
ncbi:MAG: dihydrofolate reductase family protein [Candidatus Limnocylindrales bacterium]